MAPSNRLEHAVAALGRTLDSLDAPAAIIGGIAVIAWGHARFTSDVDCAIAATPDQVNELFSIFEAQGFEPRIDDAKAFARKNLVMLLRHRESEVSIDASLALSDFERDALGEAQRKKFGSARVPVVSLTGLLTLKLIASRPRDLDDAENLMHVGAWDRDRVVSVLQAFDEAMDTDRLGAFRALEKRR